MSQFQTDNPGYPPSVPPPGMMPPYGSGMYGQPPARTSGTAITSLVLGILGCLFITALGAIIFGIVGIVSTGKPGVRGRGMAIAGLVLGVLWIAGLTGFGGLVGYGWMQTKPDRMLCKSFVQDLAAANLPAAKSLCAPSVSSTTIQQSITQMQGYGTMTSFTPFGFNYNARTSAPGTAIITGIAVFGPGVNKSFVITLTHPPGGPPLIQSWTIQ
jgi:hypothetical protein